MSPKSSKVIHGKNFERIEVHQAPPRKGANNENNITGLWDVRSNEVSPLKKV